MHKYGPVIKMLSLVTQIGITMLTSVFLCMAIGMWIDKHFSTNLFLLFLILGIMGGIRGVYSLIHNILEQEDMEDKDERLIKTARRDIPRSCDRDSFVRSVICDFGYDNNQR